METENKNTVIYKTLWVARDKEKEYPHGWGFEPPMIQFNQLYPPSLCSAMAVEEFSNDEFECIGVVPVKLIVHRTAQNEGGTTKDYESRLNNHPSQHEEQ